MGDLILVYNLLVMGSTKTPEAVAEPEVLELVKYLTHAENI